MSYQHEYDFTNYIESFTWFAFVVRIPLDKDYANLGKFSGATEKIQSIDISSDGSKCLAGELNFSGRYCAAAWWRHQMETFSALLALCAGNLPVSGDFPTQRPVTRSFDIFFDLRLIKRLSKHSRCWWFETLSRPLWRHCNGKLLTLTCICAHCIAKRCLVKGTQCNHFQ